MNFSIPIHRITKGLLILLPFAAIATFTAAVLRHEPHAWKSQTLLVLLAVLLALAALWTWHVFRTKHYALLAGIFGLGLIWCLLRTDWIVTVRSEREGRQCVDTFSPPSSPILLPPQPDDTAPEATSWNHHTFFAAGGIGGPIEEAKLHVNWFSNLAWLWGFTGVVYAAIIGFLWVERRFLSSANPHYRSRSGDRKLAAPN
jgi:hypothetical protein